MLLARIIKYLTMLFALSALVSTALVVVFGIPYLVGALDNSWLHTLIYVAFFVSLSSWVLGFVFAVIFIYYNEQRSRRRFKLKILEVVFMVVATAVVLIMFVISDTGQWMKRYLAK